MKSKQPLHPSDLDPKAGPVDALLTEAGRAYREVAEASALSPVTVARIRRAVLASAQAPTTPSLLARLHPAWWLIPSRRPLAYAFTSTMVVLACLVWAQALREPSIRVVYSAGDPQAAAPTKLHRGGALLVRQYPGSLIQVGNETRIFVRDDTAIEVVSPTVIALKTGEIWVAQKENKGGLKILTPQGTVEPVATAFGVKAGFNGEGRLDVSVLEGSVQVHRTQDSAQVPAGTRLHWTYQGGKPELTQTAVQTPQWTEEILAAVRSKTL